MDSDNLIRPDETAYRLELTAAQLKIVHTALKSLYDDLGREQHDVKQVVASVLDKLPGEHEIRAIDLDRELRALSRAAHRKESFFQLANPWRCKGFKRTHSGVAWRHWCPAPPPTSRLVLAVPPLSGPLAGGLTTGRTHGLGPPSSFSRGRASTRKSAQSVRRGSRIRRRRVGPTLGHIP